MMWKGRWQGTGYRNASGARSDSDWDTEGWGRACSDRHAHPSAEGLGRIVQSMQGGGTRGLPGLKRNQGPGSFETVTKDLRSTPTENIKGLSLDEATVCPYVTDVDKWTWTTNSAFLSSPGEVFIVGDLLLGPRGWDPVRVWEGVNSSALRCHSRTLQNEGQSTSRVFGFYQLLEKIPWGAFLHLSRVPVNTCPWGLHCEGEPSWEGWSQLWAAHRQVHWRAERHRVRGSMTLTHLPDWRPEGTWCKTRHDLPYPCPFSLHLFTHQQSLKAEGSVPWGEWRAYPPVSTTISTL